MAEAGLAFANLVVLMALSWLQANASPLALLAAGLSAVTGGTLASLVTGALYHRALYRALGRRGALPPRWWWSPTVYHARLSPEERRQVMPWFLAGATGMGLVLVGAVLAWGAALHL